MTARAAAAHDRRREAACAAGRRRGRRPELGAGALGAGGHRTLENPGRTTFSSPLPRSARIRACICATGSGAWQSARPESVNAGLRVPVRRRSRTSCTVMLLSGSLAAAPATAGTPTGASTAMPRYLDRLVPTRRTSTSGTLTRCAYRAVASIGVRVPGSRPRRLRRSRREAGGATRESWVDDRSRTGTRARTRVRRRSLGRELGTARLTQIAARLTARPISGTRAVSRSGSTAARRCRVRAPPVRRRR